jgi:ketosteroid isomerase-like protein
LPFTHHPFRKTGQLWRGARIGRCRVSVLKKISYAWLAAVLASPCSSVAAGPRAAIRGALDNWTTAFNSRDIGSVCDLFSRDLIASYQGQPERGYDALCALLSNSLKDPEKSYHYRLRVKEILVCGDLSVVRLAWTLTVEPKDGRATETIEELGSDVFRRQPDGSWKISPLPCLSHRAPPTERVR